MVATLGNTITSSDRDVAKIFNCDHFCIGGGLAALIDFKLPPHVYKSNNSEGTLGGIKLWEK